jgi:hypothetical protein
MANLVKTNPDEYLPPDKSVMQFNFGSFNWIFEIKDQISVEWVLRERMQYEATALKLGVRLSSVMGIDNLTVPREIKDALIKDNAVI